MKMTRSFYYNALCWKLESRQHFSSLETGLSHRFAPHSVEMRDLED